MASRPVRTTRPTTLEDSVQWQDDEEDQEFEVNNESEDDPIESDPPSSEESAEEEENAPKPKPSKQSKSRRARIATQTIAAPKTPKTTPSKTPNSQPIACDRCNVLNSEARKEGRRAECSRYKDKTKAIPCKQCREAGVPCLFNGRDLPQPVTSPSGSGSNGGNEDQGSELGGGMVGLMVVFVPAA